MNDRLEAFRSRLRGSEKKSSNWQFWIGSPTAWLALIISSTTAFFNFVYYTDELSVIGSPAAIFEKEGMFRVAAPNRFLFINSGSRPISVIGADIHLVQPPNKNEENFSCIGGGHYQSVDLAMEPTIVKAHDASIVQLPSFSKNTDGLPAASVSLEESNKGVPRRIILACISFDLVATDVRWSKTVAVQRVAIDAKQLREEWIGANRPVMLTTRNWFRSSPDTSDWPRSIQNSISGVATFELNRGFDQFLERKGVNGTSR
ncbi:hypothetical protein JEY40_25365 [Bradyrhizobium japonicum]|uniref:hypothetical protein n=1 Tax=Bradyrhizobium japonicum TaxID=375 RepID=UPI0020104F1D|nr:hypothetical protein [Bradyrhizobium japonicum]UQD69344.1 hypothetical protein JEY40_25365 [Bradyrhizobium japonicum]